MLDSNFIKLSLNILDSNITLTDARREFRKSQLCNVFSASLTYAPTTCPTCQRRLVANGFTHTTVNLLDSGGYKTLLELDKQRFLCKSCHHSELATTDLVDDNCNISKALKMKIYLYLKRKIDMTTIAWLLNVSVVTVERVLESCQPKAPISLPPVLAFDENHLMGDQLAFAFSDGTSHQLLDLLEDRSLESLRKYFYHFPRKNRAAVKVITMDMYRPYMTLVKALFPNAQIVIDRFHIVQHICRAFNKTRVQLMKQFKTDSPEYKHLKYFWKLLLKRVGELKLNCPYNRSYRKPISQKEIVADILARCPELERYYDILQEFFMAFDNRTPKRLFVLIDKELSKTKDKKLNSYFQTVFQTFKKYKPYIENALSSRYSNGHLEALNNLMKHVSRLGFGYRDFQMLKNRIFLILNN